MSKSKAIQALATQTGATIINLPLRQHPQPLSVKEINKLASMCVMLNEDFQFMLDTATGLRRVDNPHYRSLLRKYLTRLKLFYG